MITQEQIDKCIAVAKRYGAKRLVLFGSALADRGNARDIDFISRGVSTWAAIEMGAMMEHASHAMVDVVPEEQASPFVEFNLGRGLVVYES